MIASYCPKKGKVVTLLSTMHLVKGTESLGPEKKPEVITYYNATKGGVVNYHGPNGEMVYYQKKNSKMAHGNLL